MAGFEVGMAVVGDPRGLYGLLGVPRTATPEEIRSAFRELAKRYHPDSSSGGADDERFRRLREAYEVLRDPARRLEYDAEALDAQRRRGGDNGRRGGSDVAAGGHGFGRRRWGRGTGGDADDLQGGGPADNDDEATAAAGTARPVPPRAVLLAVAGALVLAVGGGAALVVARGNEASRLRAEADGLRVALNAASRGAEAEARARRRTAAEAGPDAALAAELGTGGGFVYRAELTFPPESGELDEVLRAELDARLAEVRTAVSGIPQGQEWLLLVDGHNARAVTEAGVLVDEWGLALLRVGSVADFLVRAGVPADRLAVRFQAGFATRGPAAGGGTGAAATAARTVELKVLCCQP